MVIKVIEVKDIMTKTNLPVSDYAVNPLWAVRMPASTAMRRS